MSDENKGYEDIGKIPIEDADDANVPVDIWLTKRNENDEEHPGKWQLRANNYMPRKACLGGERSYCAISDDREVLAALVRKHWLPLYQIAVEILTEMRPNKDDNARLYYWQK